MDKILNKNIFFCIFVICVFLLGFSPYHALMRDHLTADDASYLSHGFSLGLDYNLEYKNIVADWRTNKGNAPAHPIGPGMLAAPFIAAFSVIDRINKDPVILNHLQYQYSWSFFGFVFSTFFYFISGLFFYGQGLQRIKLAIPPWQLWFASCSFGILYYVLFRPVMGHSFEFFTLALCFYFSARWIKELFEKTKVDYFSLLGIAIGVVFTLAVRPANINIILLPFILFTSLCAIENKAVQFNKLWYSFVGLGCALALSFLPFALINQSIYGMMYPSAKEMYGNHFTPIPDLHSLTDIGSVLSLLINRLSQLMIISFSSEFGLAFSSAILFYGILFLFFYLLLSLKNKPRWGVLALFLMLGYVSLPVTVTLLWQNVGDAYGYRFLFCLFPLAIFGYSIYKNREGIKIIQNFLLACCFFGLLGSTLFGLNKELAYRPGILNAFGKEYASAVGYNTAVLHALPDPKIWLNCIATRTPGFYAVGLLEKMAIDLNALPIPTALGAKMEKFKYSYQYPPLRIYLQVLLLGAVFIGGSVAFCFSDKKR